jgi:hypothetical protein
MSHHTLVMTHYELSYVIFYHMRSQFTTVGTRRQVLNSRQDRLFILQDKTSHSSQPQDKVVLPLSCELVLS